MMYVGSCTMVFIHLGNDLNELDGGQVNKHGGYKHGVNGMGSGGWWNRYWKCNKKGRAMSMMAE